MLKKIVGWGLFALLIGVLVFGAVYRTQAKFTDETLTAGRGQTEHAGEGEGSGPLQAEVREWEAVSGQVAEVDASALVLALEDGSRLEIANRPWSYAREMGAAPQVGDTIRLTGFYDSSGVFEAVRIENLTRGQTTTLRDENGRPGWGRGRGGGGH